MRRKGKNREPGLILQGLFACSAGLLILGYMAVESPVAGKVWLYVGAACLAVTNGTVVTCLTALASFSGSVSGSGESQQEIKTSEGEKSKTTTGNSSRGQVLGVFRSIGQLGRSLGPLFACSCYWILGSVQAYLLASFLMFTLAATLTIIFSRAKAMQKIKVD